MNKPIHKDGLERRREDYTSITGHSLYVDDLRPLPGRPPILHMAVVRSIYAHAEITSIQLDAAQSLPGVIAAFVGKELVSGMPTLNSMPVPGLRRPERRPLAVNRSRYVGDPVAVVLAESPAIAEDARNLVEVDYKVLPIVTDPEAALEADAPRLYDELDSNVAFRQQTCDGDIKTAFAQADHTISLRLVNQRLAPGSLEARACLFDFDASSGKLSAWVSSQSVFRARDTLATFLNLDRHHIHVYNADVGGAFGAKSNFLGEEIIAALLAVKFERPVKWIEQRSENLQAQSQGRGQINYIEAAFKNDGKLLGMRVHSIADLGAFLTFATAMVPARTPSMLCGPYQLQAVESLMIGVFTNKATTAPYRGAGRPEAAYILERTMDAIAYELSIDPAEVRRRNFISPQAFPHTTVTGIVYDSGNYQAAMERALELGNYTDWRAKQHQYHEAANPRLLGIGLASFIELSGDSAAPGNNAPREAATVRIRQNGTILVQCGVAHTGQGHFTAFAQIVASALHLPANKVEVHMNNSDLPGYSIGTYGSRITQVAGSAVLLATEAVKEKALHLASEVWEVAPTDLLVEDGQVMVRGTPTQTVSLGELARMVEEQPALIEREVPNPANGTPIEGLAAWRDFSPPGATYSSGTHMAVVEIDPETGEIHILNYVAVDDCGRVLNHFLVEAQVHGGLAQGIGQALYEEVVYDQNGQLLSGSLMDYAMPNASMVPQFVTDFIETPSPYNPLGTKGAGESGCIGGPPAIVNAVLDGLSLFGITAIDMPLRPEKIWTLLQAAQSGTPTQFNVSPSSVFPS
ncbi:MAG TPA: xanthine dehydrogenase family protein molybdopterin-binding subunit [Ktedonobacteraceae bacterium]|nr:xanthine dehydrogenase family protein molybdopterin-binding subunit [Ktedonobacteraceae bacterium]